MDNVLKWLPVIVWSGVIFTLSSMSNIKVPTFGLNFADKIYHCVEFTIWGLLFAWSASRAGMRSPGSLAALLLIGFVFAIIDEGHQKWVPGRSFDRVDMYADWLGLVISVLICAFIKRN